MINTKKGIELIKILEKDLFLKKTDTEKAFEYNHNKNVKENKKRNEFFEKVANDKINKTNIIKNIKKYTKTSLPKKCVNKIRYVFNKIKSSR